MALHIGKIIRKRIEMTGMNKSEFARRINSTPQNVYSIFKRESIDSELLWEISRVLGYDFFQHYTSTSSNFVGEDQAVYKSASDIHKELNVVKREMEMLAQENKYLKELVKLQRNQTEKKEGASTSADEAAPSKPAVKTGRAVKTTAKATAKAKTSKPKVVKSSPTKKTTAAKKKK